MAVASMKKVTLYGLRKEQDAVLERLQQFGWVEIAPVSREEAPGEDTKGRVRQELETVEAALALVRPYVPKKNGLLNPKPRLTIPQIRERYEARKPVMAEARELLNLEGTLTQNNSRIDRLRGRAEQLEPWQNLRLPVENLKDTRECMVALGTLPQALWESFQAEAGALGNNEIEVISNGKDTVNLLLVAHKSVSDALRGQMARMGFTAAQFSGETGMPWQMRQNLENQMQELEGQNAAASARKEALAAHSAALEELYDTLSSLAEREEQRNNLSLTEASFCLKGWVPQLETPRLTEALKDYPCTALTVSDPEEGDTPPTYCINGNTVGAFEDITNMYGIPTYKGLDPNKVMAPFYVLFFGMMVSDAMYGLLIALGCALILWRKRGTGNGGLIKVLMFGGLSTCMWGILYGSYFGMSWFPPILFNPLSSPLPTLGLCFGLGLLHICVALAMQMKVAFMEKNWQAAIFDSLPWLLIMMSLAGIAMGMLLQISMITTVSTWVIGAAVLTILLMKGRGKKNPLSRLVAGLGSLYGVTSYLSDILSYARLFAMGLATGVVAMVFNEIVGMLPKNVIGIIAGAIIFAVGHVFNIALNSLGAYVHACRLQFIEFFGKFYEGGGRLYAPFRYKGKYHDVV